MNTDCMVNKESIFSSFCFVKRAKLLAHDWSSGRLATAHSIEKLFNNNNNNLISGGRHLYNCS